MSIKDSDIEDLLTTTHYNEPKGKITDISQDLQRFVVMSWLFTKNGGLIVKKSGVGIKETLMINYGGESRWIGEYDEDVIMVGDHLTKMQLNWCLLTDNLAYSRGEILENRGEDRINNVIKPRRRALQLRIAKSMENTFFDAPDADDDLSPWGLMYWIVKNPSTGFHGGYPPGGFTRIGNINLTKAPNFKNYTGTYTAVSKTDLIAKMRKAHRKTGWVAPKTMKDFEGDIGNRRVILVNEETVDALEMVGEAQNENLGRDMAPMTGDRVSTRKRDTLFVDGEITFKKHPIVWVPKVDEDTTNPVYMLDKATMKALTLKGDNMREGDFKALHGSQHRVFASHVDHKCQYMCTNRRNNVVFYQA